VVKTDLAGQQGNAVLDAVFGKSNMRAYPARPSKMGTAVSHTGPSSVSSKTACGDDHLRLGTFQCYQPGGEANAEGVG
jgi:hypothetical protein